MRAGRALALRWALSALIVAATAPAASGRKPPAVRMWCFRGHEMRVRYARNDTAECVLRVASGAERPPRAARRTSPSPPARVKPSGPCAPYALHVEEHVFRAEFNDTEDARFHGTYWCVDESGRRRNEVRFFPGVEVWGAALASGQLPLLIFCYVRLLRDVEVYVTRTPAARPSALGETWYRTHQDGGLWKSIVPPAAAADGDDDVAAAETYVYGCAANGSDARVWRSAPLRTSGLAALSVRVHNESATSCSYTPPPASESPAEVRWFMWNCLGSFNTLESSAQHRVATDGARSWLTFSQPSQRAAGWLVCFARLRNGTHARAVPVPIRVESRYAHGRQRCVVGGVGPRPHRFGVRDAWRRFYPARNVSAASTATSTVFEVSAVELRRAGYRPPASCAYRLTVPYLDSPAWEGALPLCTASATAAVDAEAAAAAASRRAETVRKNRWLVWFLGALLLIAVVYAVFGWCSSRLWARCWRRVRCLAAVDESDAMWTRGAPRYGGTRDTAHGGPCI